MEVEKMGIEERTDFIELCEELLNNDEFVSHFNRLTNSKLLVKRTPLEKMIDDAC